MFYASSRGIIGIGGASRPPRLFPKYVIGIDEAGRGPLAGPVVVAGVKIATRDRRQATMVLKSIRDSKKLTEKQREEWFSLLTAHPHFQWATAIVSPRVIDRINIAQAANFGACRVYKKLSPRAVDAAVLDGSLYLPTYILQETIIKGDEKVPVIAAASIIAKVTRDRIMRRLHKKHPQYRFDVHKGYATAMHRKLIQSFGRSPIHRKSFRTGC